MSKIFSALLVHVSVHHKTALETLKKQSGKAQSKLIEEAIEDLARKRNLEIPIVTGNSDDTGESNHGLTVAPVQRITNQESSTAIQQTVTINPPPAPAFEPARDITTKFSAWIMDLGITPADIDNIMSCLNDIPSEHGRFCAVLKQGETGPEIHLSETCGNGNILRLANNKATGKFIRIITGMRYSKLSKSARPEQTDKSRMFF